MNESEPLSTRVFKERNFLTNLFNNYLLIFHLSAKSPICFHFFFLFNKQSYEM